MVETIEVRYKEVFDGVQVFYHKYIIYTDENGSKSYARGGPSPLDGYMRNGLGPIVTIHGTYENGTPDWDNNVPHPGEVIATGSNLSSYWDAITDAMDDIETEGYAYTPGWQNSNAVVDEALSRALLPLPTLDGVGDYLSPGSDMPLFMEFDPGPELPAWLADPYGPFQQAPNQGSPLVLDLDGDGIELTTFNAATTTTFFDIEGDGFAEQTAWIAANQDGLLARDVNENGTIDDVTELFGSPNVDGFAILALLDSNQDLIIDENDDAWDELLIWKDVNGDAVSQSGELITLDTAGIRNIRLDTVQSSTSTISGNAISHTATFTWDNNSTGTVVDAWFKYDNINSYYTGDYTLDDRVLYLPTLRGFGEIPDLHIAMSQDEDLLEMVQALAMNFEMEDFGNPEVLDGVITDILYAWAGVDGVSLGSRGPYFDAQQLAFLEKFFGKPFFGQPDPLTVISPNPQAAALLTESWHGVFQHLKAALLLQSGAQQLFDNTVAYNPSSGDVEGTPGLDQALVEDLADYAPSAGPANDAYWVSVAMFIAASVGLDNLDSTENGWLDDAIYETDVTLGWDDVKNLIPDVIAGTQEGDTLSGTSGTDTLNGGGGDDTIYAYHGNDTVHGNAGNDVIDGGFDADHLYGDAGNDTLYGDGGNDILEGGSGGNLLYGYAGNDQYVYGGGNDVINEQSTGGTADQIILPSGITLGDLTFMRVWSGWGYFDDLLITIDGGGSIQIASHFYAPSAVETLVFADTSTLNLTTLAGYETFLTDDDDTYSPSLSSDDIVYGGRGNDNINTWSGNDTLDGGDGNDLLYGRDGNDTYIASAGFDTVTDTDGTDQLVIPDIVDPGNVYFYRVNGSGAGFDDLRVYLPGLGEVLVMGQFYPYSTAGVIESMHFLADDSTLSLTGQVIETRGTEGNDDITGLTSGGSINDIINGFGGDDYMAGNAGNDTYVFSAGHDRIIEVSGTDTILIRDGYSTGNIQLSRVRQGYGYDLRLTDDDGNTVQAQGHFNGTGFDIEYVQFPGGPTWTLSAMEIETHGTASGDTLTGADSGDASSADIMRGFAGADYMYGSNGDDVIYGGLDNDYLVGDADNDVLYGESGADSLYGGNGNDTLYGGDGLDTLYGNSGADTFVFEAASAFNNVDVVSDFSTGAGDAIDVADLLVGYDPLTDAITDFVTFTNSGGHSQMFVDRDGAGSTYSAQQIALVENLLSLNAETLETNNNLITM